MRRLACALLLGLTFFALGHAQTLPILLEDFATRRMNHDVPPGFLFQPYTGGSSPGPGQTAQLVTGTPNVLRTTVPTNQAPYVEFIPYPYSSITGFVKGNLKAGTWDATVNRMTFWMRANGTGILPNRGQGKDTLQVGTYTKVQDGQPSNQGDHYYHYLYANWYPGEWMLVTLNRVPTHQVGQGSGINWPENPTRWTGNPTYKAPGWDYFDGFTRFYFEASYPDKTKWGGRSYDLAEYRYGITSGEPDTLVAGITATWTGSGYELGWQAPKNQAHSYSVYYADVSMHANGLSAGTKSSTVVNAPGSDYTGCLWAVTATQHVPKYFAIVPTGSSTFTEVYLPLGPGGSGPTPPPQPIPTSTAVSCPQSVQATGMPLTPCSAKTTASDGFTASPPVTYANNVAPGQATATATFAGDSAHASSAGSGGFTITAIPPPASLTCDAVIVRPVAGKAVATCQ